MRGFSITLLSLIFILSSCSTLNLSKVAYNDDKELFEYKSGKSAIELRNDNMQLVDISNFEDFKIELYNKGLFYPFNLRTENSAILKNSDWELASSFDKINTSLRTKDYNSVFGEAGKLRSIYSDADIYSNLNFMEGYAFEKLGLDSMARYKYSRFLKYSDRTYSDRQRGYEFSDKGDGLYISHRAYSKNAISRLQQDSNPVFSQMPPKHYYDPYQPGFSLSEDMLKKRIRYLPLLIGRDLSKNISYGGQFYLTLNKAVGIYAKAMFSHDMSSFNLGLPVQLYMTADDGFGLKFTPFISYYNIDSLTTVNGRFLLNQGYVNFGTRLSAGYFLKPKLSIGAYYQYFYYNEKNKYRSKSNIEIWNVNEFDISAYYNLLKGISLKAGIKNTDVVLGLFVSGWEFSYSINHNAFIFRSNMF